MSQFAGFNYEFVKGTSARTLLLLHGTGGDERGLLAFGRQLDADASLLSPRGQVLEAGMPRFFKRLAEGVFDIEDLKFRTDQLADFIVAAAAEFGFDPANVVAVGYSNGANIAGGLLLLRPEILRAALLLRPMVPLVPDQLPELAGKPVGIAAGKADPISSLEETRRLESLLRRAGAEVEVHFAEAGHGLTAGDIAFSRGWMDALGT